MLIIKSTNLTTQPILIFEKIVTISIKYLNSIIKPLKAYLY